jgi:hypothetical protein
VSDQQGRVFKVIKGAPQVIIKMCGCVLPRAPFFSSPQLIFISIIIINNDCDTYFFHYSFPLVDCNVLLAEANLDMTQQAATSAVSPVQVLQLLRRSHMHTSFPSCKCGNVVTGGLLTCILPGCDCVTSGHQRSEWQDCSMRHDNCSNC